MKLIQIFKDGRMDEINHKGKILEKNIVKLLNKLSTSQGIGNITKLFTWFKSNYIITCYGWYDGNPGFENEHSLPCSGKSSFIDEDSSIIKLYGDIFIIKQCNDKYSKITISEYSVFYSDQCDYSDYILDDIEIDNDVSDNEYIHDDTIIEDKEFIKDDYTELDYDNNEY
jgi:hypothetical protein